MKTTMKKIAASLLVMLLVFQMLPAMADETVSNMQPPINEGAYREKLAIGAVTSTLTVGMDLQLTTTEGYNNLTWKSENEDVATVEDGQVHAVAAGTVRITASEAPYQDSITICVVDNKPAETETKPEAEQEPGEEEKPETEETANTQMIIIINGSKDKVSYTGEEQRTSYSAYSDHPEFSEDNLHLINEEKLAAGTECGVYQDMMTAEDFSYDGYSNVTIIVTNGWLQIKPLPVTIEVDDQVMAEGGETPELTARVTGLLPGDDASQIAYTLTTKNDHGTVRITAEYVEAVQGHYRITGVTDGEMTVIKAQPLYNIAKINGLYYRLAKTEIWTEKKINENLGKTLKAEDYTVNPYNFADLTITIDGKDYVYNCQANSGAIVDGANYYDVKLISVSIVKEKIGAMDGDKPRWLVPEDQRYDDPNKTNSIHRDYEITLHENLSPAIEQTAYTMLSVDGSTDYYKLPTTTIKAQPIEKVKNGFIKEGEYKLEPYDFSNTVITIDGVEYRYNDGSLTEYDNYFTVTFETVDKNEMFNRNEKWFNSDESWLDGAREQYGDLPRKTTTFHANYAATTHKAEKRQRSISLTSDFERAAGYVGEKITLTAHLTGFDGLTEGVDYRLEWQYKTGDGSWTPIANSSGTTYSFILNQTTTYYTWRVVAIDLE